MTARATPASSIPSSEADLIFRYYSQQWEQVRHCENMRSTFALQFLAIAAGSVAGYSHFKGCGVLQIVLGLVVVAIGVLGFFVVSALERAADIHIRRARAARACLPRIDAFAEGELDFLPLSRYFRALTVLISLFGLTLIIVAIHAPALTQCVLK
jgi:hypothetical protein